MLCLISDSLQLCFTCYVLASWLVSFVFYLYWYCCPAISFAQPKRPIIQCRNLFDTHPIASRTCFSLPLQATIWGLGVYNISFSTGWAGVEVWENESKLNAVFNEVPALNSLECLCKSGWRMSLWNFIYFPWTYPPSNKRDYKSPLDPALVVSVPYFVMSQLASLAALDQIGHQGIRNPFIFEIFSEKTINREAQG